MTVGIQTETSGTRQELPLVSRFDSVLARGIVLALTVVGSAVLMAPTIQGGLSTTWQQIIGVLLVVGTLVATGAGGILMWSLRQMMSKIETLTKVVSRLEQTINEDHISDETHRGDLVRLESDIKSDHDWCSRMQARQDEHQHYITEHETKISLWWKRRHEQDEKDTETHSKLAARISKLERS